MRSTLSVGQHAHHSGVTPVTFVFIRLTCRSLPFAGNFFRRKERAEFREAIEQECHRLHAQSVPVLEAARRTVRALAFPVVMEVELLCESAKVARAYFNEKSATTMFLLTGGVALLIISVVQHFLVRLFHGQLFLDEVG